MSARLKREPCRPATVRVPRRLRRDNEPLGRLHPISPLSLLECDSDTTGGPPRCGRPAALGPTRSRVARHERTDDSDDSERAGGEEAAARTTASQAKTSRANRPASWLPHPPCRRREGVLDPSRSPSSGPRSGPRSPLRCFHRLRIKINLKDCLL